MSLDIDAFRSKIMKEDLSRQNLFKVQLPTKIGKTSPSAAKSGSGGKSILKSLVDTVSKEVMARSPIVRRISGFYSPEIIRMLGLGGVLDRYLQAPYELGMFVKEVNLPGRILTTTPWDGDQVAEFPVIGSEFDPLNIQFITVPNLKERQFFLDWMNLANEVGTNKFGFYDEYVANITVNIYDRQGNIRAVCEIVDAIPIRVSDMNMSYEANSQLSVFDVSFKYKMSVTKDYTGKQGDNLFEEAKHWYDDFKRILGTFKN